MGDHRRGYGRIRPIKDATEGMSQERDGEKQQILNLLQATKDAFMCWQQRDSVGTYHERFLDTLEVAEALDSMISRDVTTATIFLKGWGLDNFDPRSITEEKWEAAFAEGEKRF